MSNKLKKRQALFKIGSHAYARFSGKSVNAYVCPICLREYFEPNGLTLEHAPQESIGGKIIALTCNTPCNSNPNSMIDNAVAGENALADFMFSRMTIPRRVRVCFGDNNVGADLIRNETGQQFAVPRKSNVQAFDRLRTEKPKVAKIDFYWGADRRLASLGLLKAAYVGAFAKFGYRYIMQHSVERVRQQIQRPDETIVHPIRYRHQGDHLQDRIRVMNKPVNHLIVQIGENFILLPGLNESSDTFWNWHRDVIAKGISYVVESCWVLSWPATLEMSLDLNTQSYPAATDLPPSAPAVHPT